MDKKVYWIITFIIAVLSCVIGCFIGSRYMPKNNNIDKTNVDVKENSPVIDDSSNDIDNSNQVNTTNDISGYYYVKYDEDQAYYINIYSDGTYTRKNGYTEGCNSHFAGKYNIVDDNIELVDSIYYECDACFSKVNTSNKISAKIVGNTLVVVDEGKTYNLNKTSEAQTQESNLLTPENNPERIDCSNMTIK